MGCWNGTCMISQLPIHEGQRVKLIPIKKQEHMTLPDAYVCYSDELYKPLPIILEGEYNDYGIIENVTGNKRQFMSLVTMMSDLTEEDILEKYKENNKIESYIRAVERGDIPNLGFVLIHEELFNSLLDTYESFFDISETVWDIYKFTCDIDGEYSISNRLKYNRVFGTPEIKDCSLETIENIIKIKSVVNSLRKLWIPQAGAGSQEMVCESHFELNKFFNKFIEKYKYEEEE